MSVVRSRVSGIATRQRSMFGMPVLGPALRLRLAVGPMLVLATVALALGGCTAAPDQGSSGSDAGIPIPDEWPEGGADVSQDAGPEGSDDGQLILLGRSVMTGWVEHWSGDPSAPFEWNGHAVTFREVEGPPGIAGSAIVAIEDAPSGSTVLFKYCFVDFNGGEYTGEMDAYLRDIERMADAAAERDVRLIIGTALPKVRAETTAELVAEHREFGRRVAQFAEERRAEGQDVAILDLNALLADETGALDRTYAVSRDDSHLNEAAYDMLDEALRPLLAERP